MGILVIVAESIPDEADLIRRSQQGDAAAFRALVAAHAEPLWRCARALCRDDHEAEQREVFDLLSVADVRESLRLARADYERAATIAVRPLGLRHVPCKPEPPARETGPQVRGIFSVRAEARVRSSRRRSAKRRAA